MTSIIFTGSDHTQDVGLYRGYTPGVVNLGPSWNSATDITDVLGKNPKISYVFLEHTEVATEDRQVT